jgi:hypothetical protein
MKYIDITNVQYFDPTSDFPSSDYQGIVRILPFSSEKLLVLMNGLTSHYVFIFNTSTQKFTDRFAISQWPNSSGICSAGDFIYYTNGSAIFKIDTLTAVETQIYDFAGNYPSAIYSRGTTNVFCLENNKLIKINSVDDSVTVDTAGIQSPLNQNTLQYLSNGYIFLPLQNSMFYLIDQAGSLNLYNYNANERVVWIKNNSVLYSYLNNGGAPDPTDALDLSTGIWGAGVNLPVQPNNALFSAMELGITATNSGLVTVTDGVEYYQFQSPDFFVYNKYFSLAVNNTVYFIKSGVTTTLGTAMVELAPVSIESLTSSTDATIVGQNITLTYKTRSSSNTKLAFAKPGYDPNDPSTYEEISQIDVSGSVDVLVDAGHVFNGIARYVIIASDGVNTAFQDIQIETTDKPILTNFTANGQTPVASVCAGTLVDFSADLSGSTAPDEARLVLDKPKDTPVDLVTLALNSNEILVDNVANLQKTYDIIVQQQLGGLPPDYTTIYLKTIKTLAPGESLIYAFGDLPAPSEGDFQFSIVLKNKTTGICTRECVCQVLQDSTSITNLLQMSLPSGAINFTIDVVEPNGPVPAGQSFISGQITNPPGTVFAQQIYAIKPGSTNELVLTSYNISTFDLTTNKILSESPDGFSTQYLIFTMGPEHFGNNYSTSKFDKNVTKAYRIAVEKNMTSGTADNVRILQELTSWNGFPINGTVYYTPFLQASVQASTVTAQTQIADPTSIIMTVMPPDNWQLSTNNRQTATVQVLTQQQPVVNNCQILLEGSSTVQFTDAQNINYFHIEPDFGIVKPYRSMISDAFNLAANWFDEIGNFQNNLNNKTLYNVFDPGSHKSLYQLIAENNWSGTIRDEHGEIVIINFNGKFWLNGAAITEFVPNSNLNLVKITTGSNDYSVIFNNTDNIFYGNPPRKIKYIQSQDIEFIPAGNFFIQDAGELPLTTTTYGVTGYNSCGSATATTTCILPKMCPTISTFTANPASINTGNSSDLEYDINMCNSAVLGVFADAIRLDITPIFNGDVRLPVQFNFNQAQAAVILNHYDILIKITDDYDQDIYTYLLQPADTEIELPDLGYEQLKTYHFAINIAVKGTSGSQLIAVPEIFKFDFIGSVFPEYAIISGMVNSVPAFDQGAIDIQPVQEPNGLEITLQNASTYIGDGILARINAQNDNCYCIAVLRTIDGNVLKYQSFHNGDAVNFEYYPHSSILGQQVTLTAGLYANNNYLGELFTQNFQCVEDSGQLKFLVIDKPTPADIKVSKFDGALTVSPSGTTEYFLIASGRNCTSRQTTTVTVNGNPTISTFSAVETECFNGDTIHLHWDAEWWATSGYLTYNGTQIPVNLTEQQKQLTAELTNDGNSNQNQEITLTVTGATGLQSVSSVHVTVKAPVQLTPNPGWEPSVVPFIEGDTRDYLVFTRAIASAELLVDGVVTKTWTSNFTRFTADIKRTEQVFKLNATGINGDTVSLDFSIIAEYRIPVIVSFSVNPTTINENGSFQVLLSTTDANSASIKGTYQLTESVEPNGTTGIAHSHIDSLVPVTDILTVTAYNTITYNVSEQRVLTTTATATLVVNSNAKADLLVDKASIRPGETTTLTWQTTGAVTASMNQGIGNLPLSGGATDIGTIQVNPTVETTYILTATGPDNVNVIRSVTVYMEGPPVVTITAAPPKIYIGECAELVLHQENSALLTVTPFGLMNTYNAELRDIIELHFYSDEAGTVEIDMQSKTTLVGMDPNSTWVKYHNIIYLLSIFVTRSNEFRIANGYYSNASYDKVYQYAVRFKEKLYGIVSGVITEINQDYYLFNNGRLFFKFYQDPVIGQKPIPMPSLATQTGTNGYLQVLSATPYGGMAYAINWPDQTKTIYTFDGSESYPYTVLSSLALQGVTPGTPQNVLVEFFAKPISTCSTTSTEVNVSITATGPTSGNISNFSQRDISNILECTLFDFSPCYDYNNHVSSIGRVNYLKEGTKTQDFAIKVCPEQTATYTAAVTGSLGTDSASTVLTATVRPSGIPVIDYFEVSPAEIIQTRSATLSWDTTMSESQSINGQPVEVSGTLTVTPTASTTYTLLSSNILGQTEQAVYLTVIPMPQITSFESSSYLVTQGDQIDLSWSTQHAIVAELTDGLGNSYTVSANGNTTLNPSQTTTYTLTVSGNETVYGDVGIVSQDLTVTALPIPTITDMTITICHSDGPSGVEECKPLDPAVGAIQDDQMYVSWTITDAASADIRFIYDVTDDQNVDPVSGVIDINLQQSLTVILRARNSLGVAVEQSQYVFVRIFPKILNFSLTPNQLREGDPLKLEWDTRQTDRCTITIDNVPSLGVVDVAKVLIINHGDDGYPLTPGYNSSTQYTLTASNSLSDDKGYGEDVQRQSVQVIAMPIIDFWAGEHDSPEYPNITIKENATATLNWEVMNADFNIEIDQGIGPVKVQGEQLVQPLVTTTYTLSASGIWGEKTSQVVVNVIPTPRIDSFAPDRATIIEGESLDLNWITRYANTGQIFQGSTHIADISPVNQGVLTIVPELPEALPHTLTYTLSITGDGTDELGPTTASFQVTMIPNPRVNYFNALPNTVIEGNEVELSWSTQYTNSTGVSINQGIGQVPQSGSIVVLPVAPTTYVLTAIGPGGITTKQVTVSMYNQPQIAQFEAIPSSIIEGQCSNLVWQTANTITNYISQGIGLVPASGSQQVCPIMSQEYELTSNGLPGTTSKSRKIFLEVLNHYPGANITVDKSNIVLGEPVELTYTATSGSWLHSVAVSGSNCVEALYEFPVPDESTILTGKLKLFPTRDTVYKLIVSNNRGFSYAEAQVFVDLQPPYVWFTAKASKESAWVGFDLKTPIKYDPDYTIWPAIRKPCGKLNRIELYQADGTMMHANTVSNFDANLFDQIKFSDFVNSNIEITSDLQYQYIGNNTIELTMTNQNEKLSINGGPIAFTAKDSVDSVEFRILKIIGIDINKILANIDIGVEDGNGFGLWSLSTHFRERTIQETNTSFIVTDKFKNATGNRPNTITQVSFRHSQATLIPLFALADVNVTVWGVKTLFDIKQVDISTDFTQVRFVFQGLSDSEVRDCVLGVSTIRKNSEIIQELKLIKTEIDVNDIHEIKLLQQSDITQSQYEITFEDGAL